MPTSERWLHQIRSIGESTEAVRRDDAEQDAAQDHGSTRGRRLAASHGCTGVSSDQPGASLSRSPAHPAALDAVLVDGSMHSPAP